MREMNQLSGGQKSLVAMALIFAIQVTTTAHTYRMILIFDHDQCFGSGFGIRIRNQKDKIDPQKQKKFKKLHYLKCWMFSFEG
jgi:hypothetical protein